MAGSKIGKNEDGLLGWCRWDGGKVCSGIAAIEKVRVKLIAICHSVVSSVRLHASKQKHYIQMLLATKRWRFGVCFVLNKMVFCYTPPLVNFLLVLLKRLVQPLLGIHIAAAKRKKTHRKRKTKRKNTFNLFVAQLVICNPSMIPKLYGLNNSNYSLCYSHFHHMSCRTVSDDQ